MEVDLCGEQVPGELVDPRSWPPAGGTQRKPLPLETGNMPGGQYCVAGWSSAPPQGLLTALPGQELKPPRAPQSCLGQPSVAWPKLKLVLVLIHSGIRS